MKVYYQDVAVILDEMHQYLSQLHKLEQEAYAKDLYLSGLFHDAVGKVINVTKDYVEVVTEY